MDIQSIDFGRILKWVLIVLVTGFIAQFGKTFAKYVMQKIRRERFPEKPEPGDSGRPVPQSTTLPPGKVPAESETPQTVTPVPFPDGKTQAKLQKKVLKTQIKKQKKGLEKP